MKGDSMKSYEVYEATLTFNDENEEVNMWMENCKWLGPKEYGRQE